jgi:aminoglycoside phosphotransferase family enzyme
MAAFGQSNLAADEPALADKVAFLGCPTSYRQRVDEVIRRETHMSWVFFAGDRVYKLKKPVRFPYLDFSTLERREAACRAEVGLNRRLAPDVYIGVTPLTVSAQGVELGGPGPVVDWLVVMRRLEDRWVLEEVIREAHLTRPHVNHVAETLVRFYRRARPVYLSAASHAAEWSRSLATNRNVLVDAELVLPPGRVRRIDRIQRRFLTECGEMLARRVRRRRIVDGHGDLRPEHIWLDHQVRIIDCLEFNRRLRMVDPFDEIAYLALECERLGARWAGERIRRGVERGLHDLCPTPLFRFYRCYRAMLRARLAIAHLLEPKPRTPEKWPRLARTYLNIAARDAASVEAFLRMRRAR